jgi:hypothetical protein
MERFSLNSESGINRRFYSATEPQPAKGGVGVSACGRIGEDAETVGEASRFASSYRYKPMLAFKWVAL